MLFHIGYYLLLFPSQSVAAMSMSNSPSTASLAVGKRPSTTEDLKIGRNNENDNDDTNEGTLGEESDTTFASAASSIALPKSKSEDFGKTSRATSTAVNNAVPSSITESKPMQFDSSSKNNSANKVKEITQDLKAKIKLLMTEIERSETENERLLGNLEKKVEALHVNLKSS